ncbi:MAG: PAS domain S-box protein, partial [Planctomycetota bacterium]
DAVFWCRPDGSFAYVNEAACRRYGYSREELLSLRVWDVSETMTRERYANWWKTFASRGEDRLSAEHRTKDGLVFPVEVSANLVRFDNEEYSATIVRDMTAHRQALEALKQSEQRFRRIFESSHDAIVMLDVEASTIVDVNPAAVALLGYSEEELRGMPVSRIHPDEMAEVERFVQDVLREGKAQTSELSCLRKDGKRVFADVSGSLLHSEEGSPLLLAIVRDATEARQAMAALRKAKQQAEAASRSKSEFLANMSHEIRTPLTAIMGYADLLNEPSLDHAERDAHIKTIKRNGQHLLSVINDILDLSRIESGRMSIERIRCSPAQIVAEVMSLLQVRAVEKGLALCAEMQPPLPETIETDPTRLRQILLNLVGNAVKFTEEGGVRVVARLVEGDASAEPALAFDVIDTGPGMDKAMLERIWKPFEQGDSTTTRKHGGTGLGLAISRRLAEALGGSIAVQSAPGEGSVFTLTIATGPLRGVRMLYEDAFTTFAESRSAAREQAANALRSVALQGRILLAEDSPDNQRLISFLLRQAGAEVDIACNGREAVEMALRSQEEDRPYGVVLMDMQMPELDGYAAVAQLRSKGWRGPVVALTAHAMAGDRERCLAAGCDDYAAKPIAKHELLELCARHLDAQAESSKAA